MFGALMAAMGMGSGACARALAFEQCRDAQHLALLYDEERLHQQQAAAMARWRPGATIYVDDVEAITGMSSFFMGRSGGCQCQYCGRYTQEPDYEHGCSGCGAPWL